MAEHESLRAADNPEASRYELYLDDQRIGFADYRLTGDRILFMYIEIEPSLNGRGFGGYLTAAALDDCRRRGLTIAARCPFIVDYIATHPEYHDIAEQPAGR